MNTRKKSILIAMALGDGYLLKDPTSNSVTLQIEHCERQRDYLEWKRDLLVSQLGGATPVIAKRFRTRKETPLTSYRFTKASKYFRIIYKWFKEDKTKYSTRIVEKLDAAGLAIWIMDDGSTKIRRRLDGSISNIQFRLSLCTPDETEVQNVIDALYTVFGIKFYRTIHMKRKIDNVPLYSICCGTKEYKKLTQIVSPFICESMSYKIV